MPMSLGESFRARINAAAGRIEKLTEAAAEQPYPGGSWLRKEVIGHLIDSSINNHIRFTVAALNGSYAGPEYDGVGWVELQGYAQLPLKFLVENWRLRNELLAALVESIPEHALNASCRIGQNQPVTLQFLIEDYLRHLDHHIDQIVE